MMAAAGQANRKAMNHLSIKSGPHPKLIQVTQQVINSERMNDIRIEKTIRCFMCRLSVLRRSIHLQAFDIVYLGVVIFQKGDGVGGFKMCL